MSAKYRMRSQDSELRFTEFLNSIYLSGMAALENRDDTPSLSVEQTYNATYRITRAEVSGLNRFFEGTDKRLLRKKHKTALAYTTQVEEWLESFDEDIEENLPELERFCSGFVVVLREIHSILNEDSQQKLRDRIVEAVIHESVNDHFSAALEEEHAS